MEPTPDTRTRLLQAALELFAQKGYHATSFREVCQLAQANNAAINYHFRDKQQLYLAAFQHAMASFPDPFPTTGPGSERTPETQLRDFIHRVLTGVLLGGPEARMSRLMSHEMLQATPLLDDVVRLAILPVHLGLQRVVAQLLATTPDSTLAADCAHNIVALCLHYDYSRPVISRIGPYPEYNPQTVEHLADHVTQFALGAIHSLRVQTPPTPPATA